MEQGMIGVSDLERGLFEDESLGMDQCMVESYVIVQVVFFS